jgi:hypothetical protein
MDEHKINKSLTQLVKIKLIKKKNQKQKQKPPHDHSNPIPNDLNFLEAVQQHNEMTHESLGSIDCMIDRMTKSTVCI